MYDIVNQIINHNWEVGGSEKQYVYVICGALIVLFSVVIIDIIRDIFHAIFRG